MPCDCDGSLEREIINVPQRNFSGDKTSEDSHYSIRQKSLEQIEFAREQKEDAEHKRRLDDKMNQALNAAAIGMLLYSAAVGGILYAGLSLINK